MRDVTIQTIEKEKIILIIRGLYGEELLNTVEACYNGGIRMVEITYNAKNDPADEKIAENIKMLVNRFGEKMLIGAGTVIRPKQVALTKKAGGRFIISPDVNPCVIKKTRRVGLVSIPGALTPSEATAAVRAGADFVKLFPSSLGGPKYLKDISAPLSHIKFLAVGGVNETTVPDFLKAGAKGFGVQSNILNKNMLAAKDYAGIEELARQFVTAVRDAEKNI